MRTRPEDFNVGWVCAIEIERVIAREVLDEEYIGDERPWFDASRDDNSYTFGRIHKHNVVIACLPYGCYGVTSAAIVATHMRSSFPAIQIRLMVGIAGGAPSAKHDIRLGDVIVSSPTPRHGGVIHYDFGKALQNHEFEITSHMAPPPNDLLTAISHLKAKHKADGQRLAERVIHVIEKNPRLTAECGRPRAERDRLYQRQYHHLDQDCDCQRIGDHESSTTQNQLVVSRKERDKSEDSPAIHYGLIASANCLMKDAAARDALIQKYDVLCFEMEAAGLMNSFPCLVIRGVCDYSDTHKNDEWQGYAAATAAVYAKELLEIIPGRNVESMEFAEKQISTAMPSPSKFYSDTLRSAIAQADIAIREYYTSTDRLRIERLSGETLSLEQCYVNLALEDISDEKQRKGIKEQMALDELFNQRKLSNGTTVEPRRIFIQGRAGIGKTTLCKKIVHEFLQHRLGDKLFDRLLWLPLRSLEHENVKYGWLELLQDAFTPSPQIPDWDTLVSTLSKQLLQPEFRFRTLFLLDGLDEISRQRKRDDKVLKFLENVICDMPNVILTSRPQANSIKIGRFDLQLDTVGFTHDQINAYIENCVADTHISSQMKELVVKRPILEGLLHIPVQLDAFCCTWQDTSTPSTKESFQAANEDYLSTMTTLYSSMSIELCKKDLIRIGRYDQSHSLRTNDVLRLLAKELQFLEELAFQGLINGITEFHPGHQESIGFHFEQSGHELPLSYSSTLEQLSFLRTSGLQLHHSKRIYHFLHLTYQEFFAARYFVRHWQTNTGLNCLNLDPDADLAEEVQSSTKFLQIEKYNPRYNIFWRFVAGLVQKRQVCEAATQVKKKDILDLFNEFHNKSRDLLGTVHCRLLMYFLSELLPNKRQDLRTDLEDLLRERMITEHEILDHDWRVDESIGAENEFPESILYSFLQDRSKVSCKFTLSALKRRPFLTVKTLQAVLELTTDRLAEDLRSIAFQIMFQNSRADSQEIVAQATQKLHVMLNDINPGIRKEAINSCIWMHSLPQNFSTALIKALKDDDFAVRRSAAYTLRQPAIRALVTILKDEDFDKRVPAVNTLKEQLDLPHKAMVSLNTVLKHKGSIMRFCVAYALKEQRSLPQEIIGSLITTFSNEDDFGRSSVLRVLEGQRSLPQETTPSLITHLRNDHQHMWDNYRILPRKESSEWPFLPQEVIRTLIIALDDKNIFVRLLAAYVLAKEPFQSDEVITALITAFKDEINLKHSLVQFYAVKALAKQSSLSKEAIEAITIELKNGNLSMRSGVAYILKEQSSLPQETVIALTAALNDECKYMRLYVAEALRIQSCLPQKVTTALIIALGDEFEYVRFNAAFALLRQSYIPKEAIAPLTIVLVAVFEEKHDTRYSYVKQIRKRHWALPLDVAVTIIAPLITIIKDRNSRLRSSGLHVLGDIWHQHQHQHQHHQEAVTAVIEALKDEDKRVRSSAAHALGKLSTLPLKVITALITAFKDEDWTVKHEAEEALGGQSTQEIIIALIAALGDKNTRYGALQALTIQYTRLHEISADLRAALITTLEKKDSSLRLAAINALEGRPWLSLPEGATESLVAVWILSLEDNDEWVRSRAAEILWELSPLPQEAIVALTSALDDKDKNVRQSAAHTLERQSSLPEEVVASLTSILVAELKDGVDLEWGSHEFLQDALAKRTPLPRVAISDLIVALKHDDELVQFSAAKVLGKQPSLSQEAVAALIPTMGELDEFVSEEAASIVRKHSPLPQEAIISLITMLKDMKWRPYLAYDILCHQDVFCSMIKDLDDQVWLSLWSFWQTETGFCCYELDGSLYLRSYGELHQISDDPVRTKHLLQVVLGTKDQDTKAQTAVGTESAVQDQSNERPSKRLRSV